MWRKIVTAVLMGVLVFGLGMAPAVAGEKEVMRLSLEEAVQLALDRNPEMALNQEAIEKARVGLREARSAADKAKTALDYSAANM